MTMNTLIWERIWICDCEFTNTGNNMQEVYSSTFNPREEKEEPPDDIRDSLQDVFLEAI